MNDSEFKFGIEWEFPLVRTAEDRYADFDNTSFEELQSIIDELPEFPEDYPGLRIGDIGIKKKRWYIEEYERYDENGKYIRCDVKGVEIRTPVSHSIDEALNTLTHDRSLFSEVASKHGFRPVSTGFNPFKTEFIPKPPLNQWELDFRGQSPEAVTANIHMLTQGPDISISKEGMSEDEVIDCAKKLTFYAPYIAVFSFNSPFYAGKLWDGYSVRSFVRNPCRPSVLAFIRDKQKLIPVKPSITEEFRIEGEIGRIEFKAIDSVPDLKLLAAITALVKGLILDTTLEGRADVPDPEVHKKVAKEGFDDNKTVDNSCRLVIAAKNALANDPDALKLNLLDEMLDSRRVPAQELIDSYKNHSDIVKSLEEVYDRHI